MGIKVLVLANSSGGLYNFRFELLKKIIDEGNELYCAVPFATRIQEMTDIGCNCIDVKMSRRGINPFEDFLLLLNYIKMIRKIKPDVVFCYTIKPNVYGGLACQIMRKPYVANITGLGDAIENKGLLQKIALLLYKMGLRKAIKVFFQNSENQKFMLENKIVKSPNDLLPGSGVNIEKHIFEEYPPERENIVFLTIGRLMKAKGTDEMLEAAKRIKKEYPSVIFRFIGDCNGDYKEKMEKAINEGIVEYLGFQTEVHPFVKDCNAILHASYHEGMSNVLLESAASGRPIIATNVPGCKETFDDGASGIAFKPKDVDDLVRAIKEFLSLTNEQKAQMGKAGRQKMEKEFNRNIIVDKYINIIENL